MMGIYKIINKTNGKYYVGSAVNLIGPHSRWSHHKQALIRKGHHNERLQRAWNKYGESVFDFIIVEETTKEKLIETEQKYLDIASNEKDKCYNLNFSAYRINLSKEEFKKRGESCRRHYLTHKSPLLGIPTGRKLSDENKEKLRQLKLGKSFSDEHKKNLKEAWKRRRIKSYQKS